MHPTPRLSLSLLLLAALLLLVWPVSAAQEQAVEPAAGVPGTTFAFFAVGFGRNAEVIFWATAPDGEVFGEGPQYDARANVDGRVDWTWTAPADALAGRWLMTVRHHEIEDRQRTISFEIVPPRAGEPGGPDVDAPNTEARNVQPAVGAPGTRFNFFATGFARKEFVGFWVTAPDGTVYSDDSQFVVRANPQGRADWSWVAPPNAGAGIWQTVAEGKQSGMQRVIFFEVRAASSAPATEEQTTNSGVEPPVGGPNDTFAFFATGYDPEERVVFWAVNPAGEELRLDGYEVQANRQGRADWYWQAPEFPTLGAWQMMGHGTKSGITQIIPFEMR